MAIRLGGLASGLDTQSIIDILMKGARAPLVRLEQQRDQIALKKTLFGQLEEKLLEFRRTLLDLRLESTFKSKTTTSSDTRYVSATATVDAEAGSHVVQVSQIATPAQARSLYTRASLVSDPPNGIGVVSVLGRPHDNLEGAHEIQVTQEGSYVRARSEFKLAGGGLIRTLTSTASLESALVEGTLATDIHDGNNRLNITVAGETVEVTLNSAVAHVTAVSHVAADLEDKINAALNLEKDTSGVTYVSVRATRDAAAGADRLVIYDVSGSGTPITVNSTSNSVHEALGFGSLASPSGAAGSTTRIVTDVTASSLEILQTKINEPTTGLIRGVQWTFADAGLSLGQAVVHTSAELNAAGPAPSVIYGVAGASSGGILNTSVNGLHNAGFALSPSSNTNGTFTINNVSITISNYQNISVDGILGLINGSGAGVTASYDAAQDRFLLISNENTGAPISLGSLSDTSDFLTLAKLTSVQGAVSSVGSFGGAVSDTVALSSAGFTLKPTSGTFTINGVSLYVNADTHTLQDVITMINQSGAQVTAGYDRTLDRFVLTSKMGTVDTNADKIELGAWSDTSNLLQALNLVDDLYASQIASTPVDGSRGLDTITIARSGSPTSTTQVYIPETLSTGAYQETAGAVNWVDGIAAKAVFHVTAGNDGTLAATWTNPLDFAITDIDRFVEHWNTAGNWSSGNVEVGVIKEGPDRLRFFNRSDGAGSAGADFTILAPGAFDLFELGLADSAPPTEFQNDSDTLALWRFNENTGTGASDGSGNGNMLNLSGASWQSGAFLYNALAFDGVDDTASAAAGSGTSLYVDGKNELSVELWVRPSAVTDSTILSKGGDGFELVLNASGQLEFSVWTSDGKQTFTSDAVLDNDRWYRITATFDGIAEDMGVVVETAGEAAVNSGAIAGAGWGAGAVVDSGGDLYLGSDSGTASWFSGTLDDLRISDTVRTPGDLGSWSRSFSNSSALVDAQYNAFTMAYAINRSGTVVRARTDDDGVLTLYSTQSGKSGGFIVSDEGSQPVNTVYDYFGASSITAEIPQGIASGARGQDAVFTVNGFTYTRSENSITDVIGGVTLRLNAPTTTPVTITIENDTEKAIDRLAAFVTSYNELLQKLSPPLLERDQQKYLKPLTQDDLDQMTLLEYEEYQRLHVLYNEYDYIRKEGSLRLLAQSLRSQVNGTVSGLNDTLNSLGDVGILPGLIGGFEDAKEGYLLLKPTGEDDYLETVREYLANNLDLVDALKYDADRFYDLFATEGSSTGGGDSGIARRLDDLMNRYVSSGGILNEQIRIQGSLDKRLLDISNRIETAEQRLERLEQRLWTQFTAMEVQMARLSRQSSSVTALLANAGLNSSQTG